MLALPARGWWETEELEGLEEKEDEMIEYCGDNTRAQQEGDTAANEANRIRRRETAVRQAWRYIAYHGLPLEVASVAERASWLAGEALGNEFVRRICEVQGNCLID